MIDRTRARTFGLTAMCACLVLAGMLAVVWGMHRPPRTAAIPLPSTPATSAPVTPGLPSTGSAHSSAGSETRGSAASKAPVSAPVKVDIPSIKEGSSLLRLGVTPEQAIAVPDQFHANQAGWFTGSPTPGQDGPAVILGHVISDAGPAVFYRLADVKIGNDINVTTAAGKVLRFAVYKVASYPKNAFPTQDVYGNTAGPELRVITCGGAFNATTGHFLNNTVLYARLVA